MIPYHKRSKKSRPSPFHKSPKTAFFAIRVAVFCTYDKILTEKLAPPKQRVFACNLQQILASKKDALAKRTSLFFVENLLLFVQKTVVFVKNFADDFVIKFNIEVIFAIAILCYFENKRLVLAHAFQKFHRLQNYVEIAS